MLDVENLHVRYGTVEAVKGLSFHVPAGSIVSLIGGNGAGKTTSLRALTGLVRARRLVVLPAPFPPMRLTMEPAGTWKDSPFTASTVP